MPDIFDIVNDLDACGVIAHCIYIYQSQGFLPNKKAIMQYCDFDDHKWRRAANKLRELGYLETTSVLPSESKLKFNFPDEWLNPPEEYRNQCQCEKAQKRREMDSLAKSI